MLSKYNSIIYIKKKIKKKMYPDQMKKIGKYSVLHWIKLMKTLIV